MSDELVTIVTFACSEEAALAKARLTEAGIDSFVADEHFASTYGDVLAGGVKLQVLADDVPLATTVLEENEKR